MIPPADQTGLSAHRNSNERRSGELMIDTIVETAIYADCLDEMERFYTDVLNLSVITKEVGRHVFLSVGPASVLLIFNPETTLQGHMLPSHGAAGPGHVAFGVSAESLDAWRTRLCEHAISIEKEHQWPTGGLSVYFRDPGGNSVELITPGVWGTPAGW